VAKIGQLEVFVTVEAGGDDDETMLFVLNIGGIDHQKSPKSPCMIKIGWKWVLKWILQWIMKCIYPLVNVYSDFSMV